MEGSQLFLDAPRIARRVEEILGQVGPALERGRVLVGCEPGHGPGDRTRARRSGRGGEPIVLVELQPDVLALGAPLDPGAVDLLGEAAPLRCGQRVVERLQRSVLEAGVRARVAERNPDVGVVGAFREQLAEDRFRRHRLRRTSSGTSRASRARPGVDCRQPRAPWPPAAPPARTRRPRRRRGRDEHIDARRQRYRSFCDATAGQLDGAWAFEDADCVYILLNELLYAEETGKLARLLVEDFKQYLAGRNPDRRRVLLIVDEFSAIADGERMARMVEVVRSYGAAVVLAPQCLDGMGGPEASARILNAARTIILHAVPDPEQIVKAAGTKMATEWSLQHERGLSTDVGSTRTQHQLRVDPNDVRRLPPGMGFVIGEGKGQKVQIAAAPRTDGAPRAHRHRLRSRPCVGRPSEPR